MQGMLSQQKAKDKPVSCSDNFRTSGTGRNPCFQKVIRLQGTSCPQKRSQLVIKAENQGQAIQVSWDAAKRWIFSVILSQSWVSI